MDFTSKTTGCRLFFKCKTFCQLIWILGMLVLWGWQNPQMILSNQRISANNNRFHYLSPVSKKYDLGSLKILLPSGAFTQVRLFGILRLIMPIETSNRCFEMHVWTSAYCVTFSGFFPQDPSMSVFWDPAMNCEYWDTQQRAHWTSLTIATFLAILLLVNSWQKSTIHYWKSHRKHIFILKPLKTLKNMSTCTCDLSDQNF